MGGGSECVVGSAFGVSGGYEDGRHGGLQPQVGENSIINVISKFETTIQGQLLLTQRQFQ